MKILLMRHGEAMDDVLNTYGGWADDELTEKGKQQIVDKSDSIKSLSLSFDKIFTSPLKRANDIGNILGKIINVPVEKLHYAAEFNGYGILSGMSKETASQKYSDQVKLLLETSDLLMNVEQLLDSDTIKLPKVLGSESVYSLTIRIKKTLEFLENSSLENVILVTHGGVIGMFYRLILKQKLQKREDCGWVLLEGSNGNYKVIDSNGIE